MNLGIIAEYNPFHNGHLLHINKSKELTSAKHVIAIMSGNFLQRGEPALINKQLRTRMALLNGVDLVIELPVKYATGSADLFAFGAVDILNKTGIIDTLSFGSEEGSLEFLNNIVDVLSDEPQMFKERLKLHLNTGCSYPTARQNALFDYLGCDISSLSSPNNILAIEYLKALKETKSSIKPFTIQREVNQYHQETLSGKISSATAIRQAVFDDNLSLALESMPQNIQSIFSNAVRDYTPTIDDYSSALHYILRTTSPEELSQISDITEGLENRILANCDAYYITDLINRIKTKRYTYTKLQRALLHIILNIKKSDYTNVGAEYIRVLGFKRSSSQLLTELSARSKVSVITNVKSSEQMLKKEITATDIYCMSTTMEINTEYTSPIVIV